MKYVPIRISVLHFNPCCCLIVSHIMNKYWNALSMAASVCSVASRRVYLRFHAEAREKRKINHSQHICNSMVSQQLICNYSTYILWSMTSLHNNNLSLYNRSYTDSTVNKSELTLFRMRVFLWL